jgi:hypothetical protein
MWRPVSVRAHFYCRSTHSASHRADDAMNKLWYWRTERTRDYLRVVEPLASVPHRIPLPCLGAPADALFGYGIIAMIWCRASVELCLGRCRDVAASAEQHSATALPYQEASVGHCRINHCRYARAAFTRHECHSVLTRAQCSSTGGSRSRSSQSGRRCQSGQFLPVCCAEVSTAL